MLKWTFDEHGIDGTAVSFLLFVAQLISAFGQGDITWLKPCFIFFLRNHKTYWYPLLPFFNYVMA